MPDSLPRGITPRLLSREAAAAYLSISPNHFDEHVVPSIPAVEGFGRRRLWDRNAIDRWLDERSGLVDAPDSTDWVGRLRDGGAGAR